MAKNDLPSVALDKINDKLEKIIDSEVLKFGAALSFVSPIETGNFRSSWTIAKLSKLHWRISNSATYADILARGRRFVNGKYEGSLQWPQGLAPMLDKTNKNIERRSKLVRE